jgi:hypothetical protein
MEFPPIEVVSAKKRFSEIKKAFPKLWPEENQLQSCEED